jgi:diguanylate cyclase (GGDEF)-like protein
MSPPVDDVRYSELLFLQTFHGSSVGWSPSDKAHAETLRLSDVLFLDLVVLLLEEQCIELENITDQMLVARLRHEAVNLLGPSGSGSPNWRNLRQQLREQLLQRSSHAVRITYRGLRRIEELREILRHERILEPFGILLDIRYFDRDLQYALRRPLDIPVSIVCADMDEFKAINDVHGHNAGDVVMRGYLQAVKDAVGFHGDAYRGSGDEVKVLLTGFDLERTIRVAEDICERVRRLSLEFDGRRLPKVTASLGISSSPPEERNRELEVIADRRQLLAKKDGKNRVVVK